MQPLNGQRPPAANAPPANTARVSPPNGAGDTPLTPAQRTTLERLIVKIMALTPARSVEIWENLRHALSIDANHNVMSRHFSAAQELLQARLDQAQATHGNSQLIQQLTELLPIGNNRQAVSDYIRQYFGHTVLSALDQSQLQQVLSLLNSGELIKELPPQPVSGSEHLAQSVNQEPETVSQPERILQPAEQRHLKQQILKLSAATGDSTALLWQSLLKLIGLDSDQPIPARYFQSLNQLLQARVALSQQAAPSLSTLFQVIKQPADQMEQQQLTDYCQQTFHLSVHGPLNTQQQEAILEYLFRLRQIQPSDSPTEPAHEPMPITRPIMPWLDPLISRLPGVFHSTPGRLLLLLGIAIILLSLLWLWLLLP